MVSMTMTTGEDGEFGAGATKAFEVRVENPEDADTTSVRVMGPNRKGSLAKIVAALTNYGLDVHSSFTRTTSNGGTVDSVFYASWDTRLDGAMFDDAGAVSQPLEESRFDDLKQYILDSMKPVVEDRFRSSLPKIYGEAAKSEALALKRRQSTMEERQSSKDSFFLATQLEVVAAELANATAQLAQIDRLYADVEACGVESLWDDISHDEHEDTCAQIEREREEARAVYERKLGAMEAALAARERSRKQITNALKDTNVFVSETKSRLPLDEKNTTMAPPKGKISTDMAPQTPFASPLSRPLPSTPCGNGRELILQGFNWELSLIHI